ncbi:Ribonuclease H-like superfamily [Arabidopsis suecica]|uniref:Ribonuclease H-like superfamily n=1 Tax=Arabidopsis suecica TaxID=45249 RepID=A0A8T1ZSC7_ARASU|nr:Ribonuclease H-like superfamily [Arabidopsis suecica]
MTGSDEKDGGSSGKLTVGNSSGEAALISPYYLHNNDNTGQVLTPILLNGTNYERWSKLMMNALRTKRKVGFLTGNFKRPANEGDDAERWDMVNSMIIGWIYSSVEPKLRSSISLVDDVSEMWSSLKSRFSVSDGTREHQLHADLTGCKQDGQTVEEYYGKLKILWDDIADIDKGFICCCGSSSCSSMKKHKKKQDGLRIHQFLMGLDNQKFGTTRSNLLSRLHELTLESVYSQIIQEERHIHATREPQEKGGVVGFSASASGAFKTQTSTCSHCGKTGHDKSQCYKIVGYPEWWNEPSHPNAGRGNSGRGRGSTRGRGRGRGPPFSASHVSAAVTTSSPTTGTTQLTDSQLTALADFVEKNKKSIGASKEGFSGKSEKLILYGTHSRFNLIIDSGASHHMTGDMSLLTEIQKIDPCPIKLPNDKITWATRYGTLLLGGKLILHHVFYAPELSITLISVSQLLRDIASVVIFTKKFCVIQDQASRTLIGAGTERDGVYHLAGAVLPQSNRVGKADNRELWHRRMGHPSPKVLSFLSDVGVFNNSVSNLEECCDVCFRAKQTRVPFSESSNKADDLFSLIHCDVWGPYRTKATCGAVYFLTIVDDFSRAVWTHLLIEKSSVATVLKNFVAWALRQFDKKVKTIRTDNGTELMCLRSYFAENGITHHTSCVDTPQQNGRVERKHRHILNVARALLFQARLPTKFWGESIQAATHLINRTPSSLLKGKTPYQVLFQKSPSYDDIRIFGCLCYAKLVRRSNDKFEDRSARCMFLGYPFGKKGWLVMDLQTEKVFVSRDVIFHEDSFPYSEEASENQDYQLLEGNDRQGESLSLLDNEPMHTNTSPIDTVAAQTTEPEGSIDPLQQTEEEENRSVDPDTSLIDPTVKHVPEKSGSKEEEVAQTADIEELGIGKRKKMRSVLLEPYVTYSATQLDKPPHVDSLSIEISSSRCLYPLTDYVSIDRFSPPQQLFLAAISADTEPVSFKEAMSDPRWTNAVQGEVGALEENETWDIVTLPEGKHAIGCKWVFRIKYNSDGSIERFKARLVALGNRQEEGTDYNETFAPVVKMTTIRTLLKIASARDWELFQMDVHNAFLHGDLEEEIYMKLPPGINNTDSSKVCKLKKSLYGLKQAPRCWFAKLSNALLEFGFVTNYTDSSLFTYFSGKSCLYVLVYVDDFIVGGNDSKLTTEFKRYMSECFHMKDLGPLKFFLGIEVSRGKQGIYISQRKYTLDIISECGMIGAKPVSTPIEQNHTLAKEEGEFYSDPTKYRRLVGRLVYLAITRPDLCYAVHLLAQFLTQPRQRHWDAAIRLVRYLKGTCGQGLLLNKDSDLHVDAYCDSDHSTCPRTRRSLSGYVVLLGKSPICWKTKKQDRVSLSSAEAEYRAMAYTYQELIWIKELLLIFQIPHPEPITLHCDNKAALHIAANPVFHERTKHIERDCHFVRDGIKDGVVSTKHVRTTEQLADFLTKPLGRNQFQYLLGKMGVRDLHCPS